MKTKLLRKVRKQYSIVFFKKGSYNPHSDTFIKTDVYRVHKNWSDRYSYESTKNDCLDWIMKSVKARFGKANKGQGIKIWFV